MEQLRIKKSNVYEIEVNDRGESISFNLDDIELPLKMNEAYMAVEQIVQKTKSKMDLIEKRKNSGKKRGFMSEKDLKMAEAWKAAFQEMRGAMDLFLGDGACQKIFGDVNYPEMFDDLFRELEPHFDKMGVLAESIYDKIENKYAPADLDVLK